MDHPEAVAAILATTGYILYKRQRRIIGRRLKKPRIELTEEESPADTYPRTYRSFRSDESFFESTRMSLSTFDDLLNIVGPKLEKHSFRKPIDPEGRLYMTLLHLSTNTSPDSLATFFNVSISAVRAVITDTCSVLWETLSPEYVKMPSTAEEWTAIAEQYENLWNMPNCIGALDARIVQFVSGRSRFGSDVTTRDLVLICSCDANYVFTHVDLVDNEKEIFSQTSLRQVLNNEMQQLPASRSVAEKTPPLPYFMVGTTSFPLLKHLIRPYAGQMLDQRRAHFNSRCQTAHRTVENAFGILTSRWRILLSPMTKKPKNIVHIVRACVVLHNFLKLKDLLYCPRGYGDLIDEAGRIQDGHWRLETNGLQPATGQGESHSENTDFVYRDILARCFY
ncbi:uncharacterized protein LOC132258805 [Phlebotomus argentipes]|uniref:uncharacterized protein LOC132258805 n=1 Tax=Phlebotomus argentipes TaxID=94469 RepID=UPI00289376DC|nr:uncharacterized protein LOC132258805 [Phlebotomus argentipes]